jgi:hypothetical protein
LNGWWLLGFDGGNQSLIIENEQEALYLSGDHLHITVVRRFYDRDHVGCVVYQKRMLVVAG